MDATPPAVNEEDLLESEHTLKGLLEHLDGDVQVGPAPLAVPLCLAAIAALAHGTVVIHIHVEDKFLFLRMYMSAIAQRRVIFHCLLTPTQLPPWEGIL